jgi:Ser/Thr protein kinase RdoA (MazF antagonist)
MQAHSAATHDLLVHLERVGFGGAPRFLGVDDEGREVLSYVAGVAPIDPYPGWAHEDRALVSVARLLRSYHDAVESFDPGGRDWPTRIPAGYGPLLVSHNDPNLDNVVFRDGEAVGLIDFDLAAPGSRIWDVGVAARLWAPLRAPADVHDVRRGRAFERLRLFVDAYGLDAAERRLLLAALVASHDWIYGFIESAARAGRGGFAQYWTGEVPSRVHRTREWLEASADALRRVLA